MKLLLDTHVWIWSQESPESLGKQTCSDLLNQKNQLFLSPTSTLEIARLLALNRLELKMDLPQWVEQTSLLLKADTLVITHAIALAAYRLPELFHCDPADRLLAATARVHGLHLVTADELLLKYPHVSTRDART